MQCLYVQKHFNSYVIVTHIIIKLHIIICKQCSFFFLSDGEDVNYTYMMYTVHPNLIFQKSMTLTDNSVYPNFQINS